MSRDSHWRSPLLAAVVLAGASAPAAQSPPPAWPGLWGPARTGHSAAPLASPPREMKQLWRRPAAGGYSEIVAAGDRVYTLELRGNADVAVALDAASGREHWSARIGDTYRGHEGSHDGPISTPALDRDLLVALGPHGQLVALDAATGKERWRHDLVKAFGAEEPAYGFGSSPLVEGNLVVVQTGGEKSQGLLAFDRATGRLAWSAPHAKQNGYASPVVATLAGTRQIVVAAGDRVFAVAPENGRQLWSVAGPGREEVFNSPLVLPDDRVLLTFWGEAVLLKVSSAGGALSAAELWRSPRLRSSNGPTIYRDNHLYGFGGAMLVCVDAATGDVKWRQRTYEGSLVGLGPHLLLLGRNSGDLQVIRASPEGYAEVLRTRVFTPGATSITGPSHAGGRVFLRNVEEMAAFSLGG